MANLTLAVDDELLRAARVKAVLQGTSVNEICREAIARFAAPEHDSSDFMAQLLAVAARMPAQAAAAPAWASREAMYDETLAERLPGVWNSPGPADQ